VSAPEEFLFAMKLAGRDDFERVLGEVATTVFRQVGCAPAVVADLVAELNEAIMPGADEGAGFDVQFRAHGGSCEVIVLVRDREIWRTSRPIP
jgi:hypothetical protein